PRKEEPVEKITEGGILSVAITNPLQSSHPVNITLLENIEVFSTVFETIIRTDEQGTLIPHLCERWEALDEGARFNFVLRKKVSLHDGRRLTAAELKTALENSVRSCQHPLPPAFAAIAGASDHQKGSTKNVTGIVALSEDTIQIQLRERLPIYPALLTDPRSAIAAPAIEGTALLGTGPFKIANVSPEGVELERNQDYWKGTPAHVEAVRFHVAGSVGQMAEGFRAGKYDLVREIQPQDLDAILRDRQKQATLAEVSLKNVFFILFNNSSPLCRNVELRRALTGIIRTQDLVRSTLGRLGNPAGGFLPPGVFGHDPGRRRYPISIDEARK